MYYILSLALGYNHNTERLAIPSSIYTLHTHLVYECMHILL